MYIVTYVHKYILYVLVLFVQYVPWCICTCVHIMYIVHIVLIMYNMYFVTYVHRYILYVQFPFCTICTYVHMYRCTQWYILVHYVHLYTCTVVHNLHNMYNMYTFSLAAGQIAGSGEDFGAFMLIVLFSIVSYELTRWLLQ